MPVAERSENRIIIQSEYRERELVKQLPGARWDGEALFPGAAKAGLWWMPLSWAGCVQLRGVFGDSLQVGSALAEWGRTERDERVNPCLELRTAEDSDDLTFMTALRPFQRAGVKFLSTARQALLADEMGLGKTVQAIAALEALGNDAYPALIVAPNSMKLTWADEFAKWAPGRRVTVITGGKVAKGKQIATVRDDEADVLIINWEALRLHTRLAGYGQMQLSEKDKTPKELNTIEWKSVVADEAHKAKDPKSQQTRSLWWLGDSCSGQRFMLTGTPVANSPEDIWSLMRFVSPLEFPAKTKFLGRYALQSWNQFGGMEVMGIRSEHREELFKVLDPRFIRRTKAAVLPQLPAKQYSVRTVELGTKQRKAYEAIRKEMMAELEGGTLITTNPLSKMTRLLQFASAHGEINEDGDLTLTDPSCKVDALEEIAAELGGKSAAVFSESRQLIEIAHKRLVKAGYKVGLITGTIAAGERQANVKAFNAGELQFLLITLGAGGEGLSLQGSSTAIFLQRSFSMVKNVQAEDRLHGIGRGIEGQALEIIDIVAQDTAEARVHEARATKAERLEEIARDADTLKVWLAK